MTTPRSMRLSMSVQLFLLFVAFVLLEGFFLMSSQLLSGMRTTYTGSTASVSTYSVPRDVRSTPAGLEDELLYDEGEVDVSMKEHVTVARNDVSVDAGPSVRTVAASFPGVERFDAPRAHVRPPWTGSNSTELCPPLSPDLRGNLNVSKHAPLDLAEVVRLNPGLEPGGHYSPAGCQARHQVVIVVPYRDRFHHLRVLLHNLHPVLRRQQLDYFILVVELAMPTTFNRGVLMNIGAVEAVGLRPTVQCLILHDVDLLPENDHNLYHCSPSPMHLAPAQDKWDYKIKWPAYFGGASTVSKEQFWHVNGFPNRFFGWGGEDDDFVRRLGAAGYKINRPSLSVGRYQMINHTRDATNQANPLRFKMLNIWKNAQGKDGIRSLQYRVEALELREGYTWLLVSVDEDAVLKDFQDVLGVKKTKQKSP